jgi:hypothetical protein
MVSYLARQSVSRLLHSSFRHNSSALSISSSPEHKLPQACLVLEQLNPFLGNPHCSFLKLCSLRSYYSYIEKVYVGYYALVTQTTLNSRCSGVSLYASDHQRLFNHPHSESLKQCFRQYPCQNTTTGPSSNPAQAGAIGWPLLPLHFHVILVPNFILSFEAR